MAHPVLPAKEMMAYASEVRERYAREVFDVAVIGALIKERASQGIDWLQVRQAKPMRLQATRAAMRLIGWLARGQYRIDWQEVVPAGGDHETAQYAELRIYWSDRLQAVSVPAERWLANGGHVVEDAGAETLPG